MINVKITVGIDSFLKENTCKKKRIGLITNQTGITSEGVPTWKAIRSEGYDLSVIFGPEHGFRGNAQDAVPVEDDDYNGIRVISLFGSRLSPAPEMLKELDLLLYDIQDIGCRYYTYLYTLALSMKTCEKTKTDLIVLDRPNPISFLPVEGNMIREEYSSFVGGYGLTNIHGMTTGEFALYLKEFYYRKVNLRVIPVDSYNRSIPFYKTELPWVSPSPNIPSLTTAAIYPGSCLFEGTNVSEGRGTTRPFEIIGAPWINGENLREQLSELHLPGISFTSLFFTPVFSKYSGKPCSGICIHILDNNVFKPLYTGLSLLYTVRNMYPAMFKWKPDWENKSSFFIDRLTGSASVREMIDRGADASEIYSELCTDKEIFLERRSRILLYQ